MQPLFQQGTAITLRLLLFSALSLSIMTFDHRYDHLAWLRAQLNAIIYPLQLIVDLPASAASWTADIVSSHRYLMKENARLHDEQLRLLARLQKLDALETENARLRELLGSSSQVGDTVLIAELLAVDLDPYRQQVIINKGVNNRVFVGQPVIDAHGVMGQVVHVAPATATALLISDPSHALPVQVNRTGLRTIASGTGSPARIELLYIPTTADIKVDDAVFTSGLGGRFPPDYPVATVTSVERPPGYAFARVFATPTARLDRSREVLLVWHEQPQTAATEATQ